jgi:hypothetical protein
MNENKFLKNLNQKPAATTPLPVSSTPLPVSPDPIQRLVDELSRHSQAIEGLNRRFDLWEQQPRGATPDQLATLMGEARQAVRVGVDTDKLAGALLPKLTEEMLTPATLKQAIQEGVTELQAVSEATTKQIDQTTSSAVARMERAGRSKVNELATYIGFASWQSALLIFGGFFVLVGGAVLANQQREAALAQSRTETQAVREFTNWVKSQPEGKRLYDRYYNP